MNAKKRSNIHKVFLYTCLSFVIAFGLMSIVGTGGGSSDGYTDPCSIGGLYIKGPTSGESYSTSFTPISLRGTAPFASDWSYPDPGVRVSWNNNATGESGGAHSWVDCEPIGYPPFVFCIYYHRWSARIPLLEGENPITVTASEDGEIVGGDCITVTYIPEIPDTTAPTIPTNLTATPISSSRIDLSWEASTDDVGVEGYNIYRDGTYIRSVTETSASDTELSSSTQYCYTVSAYDTSGNESPESNEACATTLDVTSPSVPTNLMAIAVSSTEIDLLWGASTDDVGVEGYKVYRDGIHIQDTTATSFSDTGLSPETHHCYTVSAYDTSGNESPESNEACATTSWAIYSIDSQKGGHTSIAADSLDRVHISFDSSYPDSGLKYATNASGSWVASTVDSVGGEYTSIAVDSLDRVHISYNDFSYYHYKLKYATNASGAWAIDTIDSLGHLAGRVGDTSIAVDSLDRVHISYSDYNSDGGVYRYDLKYATNASGAWVIDTIDSGGDNPSIAVDSLGRVHISYNDRYDLKYATNASGVWVAYAIDDAQRGYNSIAIDSADKVHISYSGTNGELKYATKR